MSYAGVDHAPGAGDRPGQDPGGGCIDALLRRDISLGILTAILAGVLTLAVTVPARLSRPQPALWRSVTGHLGGEIWASRWRRRPRGSAQLPPGQPMPSPPRMDWMRTVADRTATAATLMVATILKARPLAAPPRTLVRLARIST
jgi:hypothetical protein